MTPEERNDLLFQVQRALDGAGIGRLNFYNESINNIPLGDGLYVQINPFSQDAEVIQNDPFEPGFDNGTTFTFAELFPELEWEDYPQGERSVAFIGYWAAFKIFWDAPSTLRIQNDGQRVELDFHTQDIAKETAQMIADQLAKADRARKEAGS